MVQREMLSLSVPEERVGLLKDSVRILFCSTEWKGWKAQGERHIGWQLEQLEQHNTNTFGLQSWLDKTFPFETMIPWDIFDVVWLHLSPRPMFPAWHSFPSLIRRILNKRKAKAKIVITHEYADLHVSERPPMQIVRAFNKADYLFQYTKTAFKAWQKWLKIPVIYDYISNPLCDVKKPFPKPLSSEERKGLVFIRHSNITPMQRKFLIAKKAKIPAIAIDAKPFSDGSELRQIADAVGCRAKCYGRMEWEEYIDVLNQCKIGLEYDYVGINRFSYECAMLGIPVIGTENAELRRFLFPALSMDDIKKAVNTVRMFNANSLLCGKFGYFGKEMAEILFSDEVLNVNMKGILEEILS